MSLLMLYRPFPRTGSPAAPPAGAPVRKKRHPTEDEWLGVVLRPEDGSPDRWTGYHR